MQMKRKFSERFVATLVVFMMMFSNFAPLGTALVVYADDSSSDAINYSAQFVMINNTDNNEQQNQTSTVGGSESVLSIEDALSPEESNQTKEDVQEPKNEVAENNQNSVSNNKQNEVTNETANSVENGDQSPENVTNIEGNEVAIPENGNTSSNNNEGSTANAIEEDVSSNVVTNNTVENNTVENDSSINDNNNESADQVLENGLAIEITLGVKTNGYLKNAKVDIKDLANQIFKLKDNISLGNYIQSIEDGKIKLRQINAGTEVKVYIPIELKDEDSVDIKKLQEGVELNLVGTYVDEQGNEAIITKSTKPILQMSNDMNLVVGSNIEKFIPYNKDGYKEALVQIKVSLGSDVKGQLPIKDSSLEVNLPQIEGAGIRDVNVSAISTGFTNGLQNGDVVFTVENWSYENGKVTIYQSNPEKDGRYLRSVGNDEYVISYTYEDFSDLSDGKLSATVSAKANIFTSGDTKEISTSVENSYDLSQANSNIITYDVTRKTQDVSKGYLYANANAEEPTYAVKYDNAFDINISRVDLLNSVQINEGTEYFVDGQNYGYPTSTDAGENTYYDKVRLNKSNLLSIIGDNGNFELLLEDGTVLIQINKDTADDGDGYITVEFGENRIGKLIMRVNNPSGDGILNVVTTKVIDKVNYGKMELASFTGIQEDFVGTAELKEGLTTEMGTKTVSTELTETTTGATVSLSRTDLSTLVNNEDVEFNISLNNAQDTSDVYKNPVFELTFPNEIESVSIKDMNLLYGNDELDIANVETLRDSENRVVIKVTLKGAQTKYTTGGSDKGASIILKADIKTDMYTASKKGALVMKYYNEDATNYVISSDWNMITPPSAYMLNGRQGTFDTELNVVAPAGFVSAQMISNYKDDATLISVDQGRKEDTIETFADSKNAEMKMLLINNSDEEFNNVRILGRTIFDGNKSIISKEALGTNMTAPMTSKISSKVKGFSYTVYYTENGEATEDLNNSSNGWTTEPASLADVKSYLIVIDENVKPGDMLTFAYNFEIPADLNNNLDLAGTFATYYNIGDNSTGYVEPDKVVLTTGDAPVLNAEMKTDVQGDSVIKGQYIDYTIDIRNDGRSTAGKVVLKANIPEGVIYVDNGVADPNLRELSIDVGDLNEHESSTVKFRLEIPEDFSGEIDLVATVEADGLEKPITLKQDKAYSVDNSQITVNLTSTKDGYPMLPDEEMTYSLKITNDNNSNINNVTVKQIVPEGLDVVDAYVGGDESNKGNFDENSRTVIWNIASLGEAKTCTLVVKSKDLGVDEKDLVSSATVESSDLKAIYNSEENHIQYAKPKLEVKSYTTSDNRYINEGDFIEYVLEVKNVGKVADTIDIKNALPEGLTMISGTCEFDSGRSIDPFISENFSLNTYIDAGETAKIALLCHAENLQESGEKIVNTSWTVGGANVETVETPKIDNILQPAINTSVGAVASSEEYSVETASENNAQTTFAGITTVGSATANNEVVNPDASYRIIGKAFDDKNKNGQRDDDEEGMANVVAKLCDISSQEIVAQVVTNSVGEYVFDNVKPGEYYVKFEYDTTKYQLTDYKKQGVMADRNSDAIIANYKAVTDKIQITDSSVSDIDIGLVKAGIFDLSLDANINKITVQNDKETNTYEMENPKLAKIDINPKYADSSKIYVEYTVTVANRGEIAGYVKSLVDYLPDGLDLDTSINSGWYIGSDGNAYTTQLADDLIQPGETRDIKLVLTKQMTDTSTGIINNTFEIAQTYNQYAIDDIDSVPGNQAQDEDDLSKADVIIGIQTGGSMINVMIISATLITVLIALYVIKIQIDKGNKEVIV